MEIRWEQYKEPRWNFRPWDKWWWFYILEKPASDCSWPRAIVCRMRNHPKGVVWFNPSGLEPDMHCKNCGDDLG
jgi:hypothetical protein